MTWERRYRWSLLVRTSLVVWATVALCMALVIARLVWWVDCQRQWEVFGFSPEGARATLSTLVGSMLTFIVFVLSATMIVVQLASGQLTPRVIGLVFSLPWVRITLSVFTFTYAYTLAALSRVEDRVPNLHVGVAVLLNLMCIVVFFLFVQRLSTGLRPSTMMRLVAIRGRKVIDQVYPTLFNPAHPEETSGVSLPEESTQEIVLEGTAGVVMAMNTELMAHIARSAGVVVTVVPQVGDSIAAGDALFRIHGCKQTLPGDALRGCLAIGAERTLEQDPRFVFRILVDIANRALSPAINDPTTAVQSLDQIDTLLLALGRRRLDEGVVRDPDGVPRVVYGTPDWIDFVTLAVSEIRHFGDGSIQVDRRLRAMLERLIRDLPATRRPPLEEELALLSYAVERRFRDECDRRRAAVGDYQGVGGSE